MMARPMDKIVIYMRQVASVFALISAISAIVFVVLAFLISSPLPETCQMSYSKPRYARTILPPTLTMEKFSKNYALFTYTDGFARYIMSKITDSLTIVAFFPGNVGSYKQIRSIASRIIRKIPEGVLRDAVEHYTFDFGEEMSALSASSLQSQAAFASDALLSLVNSRMKSLNLDRSLISIILIGHSMGGSVVSSLFSQADFPSDLVSAIYILGSPIRAPVLTTEFALHDFYQSQRHFWNLQNARNLQGLNDVLFVSVSGGMNDLLVENSLSDMTGVINGANSISVVASQIPEVDLPVEHQVLVWCSELVEVLATSVISMIDFESKSPTERKARRNELAHEELLRFSYPWPRPVNTFVNSQIEQRRDSEMTRNKKVSFDNSVDGNSSTILIDIPDWEVISSALVASTHEDIRIFGCASESSCIPLRFFAFNNIRNSAGAPHGIFAFENLHASGMRYMRFETAESHINNTRFRVWGTFSEHPIEMKREWGGYELRDTSFDVISIEHSLSTDLFCKVSLEPVYCQVSSNRIASFALITLDNTGSSQSAIVHENSPKEIRFYRTATITKGINFVLVLDRNCQYKVSIVPLKMASMLSTLFHDFAIIPQVLVAMTFFLVTIQLIQFHNWKQVHRVLPIHKIIVKYIPEIVILCGFMSIALPFALNFRIPDRGPSASVPLPIPQSLWPIFAVCLLFLIILSSLLETLLHPWLILRIALSVPLHRLTSPQTLHALFVLTIPVYFIVSPMFYSIIVGLVALSEFISNSYRDASSSMLIVPRLLKCSWMMIHLLLLISCIPRWTAFHYPNPMSSMLALIDFLLFIMTNWSFVLASFIFVTHDLKRVIPIALITFGITLLLWAPRSIAIFPVITLFLWILAGVCFLDRTSVSETDREIYLKLENSSNKFE